MPKPSTAPALTPRPEVQVEDQPPLLAAPAAEDPMHFRNVGALGRQHRRSQARKAATRGSAGRRPAARGA